MSNQPAVTRTFTKSDGSWPVESTLPVFDFLQILNYSDNVFKNYDVTKFDINLIQMGLELCKGKKAEMVTMVTQEFMIFKNQK